ncbi:MAG: transglutaminase domain-containing protein, partial [Thermoplasmata archaeon]|nr:transglutaminase domain-containing protein [Thermoplasmata archaeon]
KVKEKTTKRKPNPYKRKIMRRRAIKLAILVAIILFLTLPQFSGPRDRILNDPMIKQLYTPYREFPETADIIMRMNFTITSHGGPVSRVTLKVPVPKDIPSDGYFQDVKRIETSEPPDSGPPDLNSQTQEMMYWELRNFVGQKTISVTYYIKTRTYKWDIDEKDSGTVNDIPQEIKEKYLHDQWPIYDENGDPVDLDGDGKVDYRYWPSNESLKNLAIQLTKDEKTVLGKIRAIYNWVVENIKYPTPTEMQIDSERYWGYPKYAWGTYMDKRGDCDDQSILMATLARAVGIPAWLEVGHLYDPSQDMWGGHGWFNVYIPLKNGDYVIAPIDPVNREFLLRDAFRLTDWIDTGGNVTVDGDTVDNLEYYYTIFRTTGGIIFGSASLEMNSDSIKFETHGKVKDFVEEKITSPSDLFKYKTPALPDYTAVSFILAAIPATLYALINRRKKI